MKKSARGFRGKYFTIAGICALHNEVKLQSISTTLESIGYRKILQEDSEGEVDPPDDELLLTETLTLEIDSQAPT